MPLQRNRDDVGDDALRDFLGINTYFKVNDLKKRSKQYILSLIFEYENNKSKNKGTLSNETEDELNNETEDELNNEDGLEHKIVEFAKGIGLFKNITDAINFYDSGEIKEDSSKNFDELVSKLKKLYGPKSDNALGRILHKLKQYGEDFISIPAELCKDARCCIGEQSLGTVTKKFFITLIVGDEYCDNLISLSWELITLKEDQKKPKKNDVNQELIEKQSNSALLPYNELREGGRVNQEIVDVNQVLSDGTSESGGYVSSLNNIPQSASCKRVVEIIPEACNDDNTMSCYLRSKNVTGGVFYNSNSEEIFL